jgi:hypothetical protein
MRVKTMIEAIANTTSVCPMRRRMKNPIHCLVEPGRRQCGYSGRIREHKL